LDRDSIKTDIMISSRCLNDQKISRIKESIRRAIDEALRNIDPETEPVFGKVSFEDD